MDEPDTRAAEEISIGTWIEARKAIDARAHYHIQRVSFVVLSLGAGAAFLRLVTKEMLATEPSLAEPLILAGAALVGLLAAGSMMVRTHRYVMGRDKEAPILAAGIAGGAGAVVLATGFAELAFVDPVSIVALLAFLGAPLVAALTLMGLKPATPPARQPAHPRTTWGRALGVFGRVWSSAWSGTKQATAYLAGSVSFGAYLIVFLFSFIVMSLMAGENGVTLDLLYVVGTAVAGVALVVFSGILTEEAPNDERQLAILYEDFRAGRMGADEARHRIIQVAATSAGPLDDAAEDANGA